MADPRHVVFVIGGLAAGGSERQLTELVTRIHPQRVNVTLILLTKAKPSERLARVHAAGIQVDVVGEVDTHRLLRPLVTAWRMWRIIRRINPAAVYCWLEEASLYGVPVARLQGRRALVARRNISGPDLERRYRFIGIAIRGIEARAHLVTGNSVAVIEQAVQRGISRGRLRLVYNGYSAFAERGSLPGRGTLRLGYLAQMRPEKGHLRFVEVLRQLPRDGPWCAVLAGDGALRKPVEEAIRRAGLETKVEVLGEISDPHEFWSQCDIAVLLSDHEGLPNALIEAAAVGLPMIGTAVGGMEEVIGDGGILVDPQDPQAAASALGRLIADPPLRQSLGVRALKTATRFSMETFVAGHLAAIDEALR